MHKLPATHPLFTLGWEPKDFWWCCCCCYQVTFFYYYSPAPPFPKSIHLHLFAGKEERHAQKSSANCLLLYFYYLMDRPVYHITGGEGGGGGREKRRRKTTSDASTARLQLERSLLEEEGGRGEISGAKNGHGCSSWSLLLSSCRRLTSPDDLYQSENTGCVRNIVYGILNKTKALNAMFLYATF